MLSRQSMKKGPYINDVYFPKIDILSRKNNGNTIKQFLFKNVKKNYSSTKQNFCHSY